jgi:hypothetical protein
MDELNLWEDTMLIINTDHGFMLGEKKWWAKGIQPVYNELANTPLFIWDPRSKKRNQRRKALVQTIDLAPTLLDFFNVEIPSSVEGKILKETIDSDKKVRDAALYGFHGGSVNMVTQDGYVYMRGPNPMNEPIFNYTLMPTHMQGFFQLRELQTAELVDPFSFMKGCKPIKTKSGRGMTNGYIYGTSIFNLNTDPNQDTSIVDNEMEKELIRKLIKLLKDCDCPKEQFSRLELPIDEQVTDLDCRANDKRHLSDGLIGNHQITWSNKSKSMFYGFLHLYPNHLKKSYILEFEKNLVEMKIKEIDEERVIKIFKKITPAQFHGIFTFFEPIISEKGV